MNTFGLPYTTVAEARTLLGEKFYGSDTTSPDFYAALNEVGQYLYTQGTWEGTLARYAFTLPTDKILVLPFHLECLRGIRLGSKPRTIVAGTHEFLGNGIGDMTLTDTKLVVRETYSATSVSWPSGKSGTISLTGSGTEAVRLFGTDSSGNEILDTEGSPGETVLVGATSAKTFYSLTGMAKPVTIGPVTVTLNCSPVTSLGVVPAGVTNPTCDRYQIRDSTATTVTVLCNRRWVNVAREEDFIVPWVTRAWKLALMAKEKEDNGNLKDALAYYQEAIAALNADVKKREADLFATGQYFGSGEG